MNILAKLTIRQMKLNKRRTIVTLIGVIISVAMITAVSTLSGSFLKLFERITIQERGNFHVCFDSILPSELSIITDSDCYDQLFIEQEKGLSQTPRSFNSKHFIRFAGYTKEGFSMMNIELTKGRFPVNSSELVLSDAVMKLENNPYQIGETITFTTGTRNQPSSGEELDTAYSYQSGEIFIETGSVTYTIVGYASMPTIEQSYLSYLNGLTLLDNAGLDSSIPINVRYTASPLNKSLFSKANKLYSSMTAGNLNTNSSLLMYQGIIADPQIHGMLIILTVILLFIIMGGSIALIYNSFAISVTDRLSDFGMLASIGATKKQRRKIVLLEACMIGCIAIPVGIFCGLGGIAVTFGIVSPMLTGIFSSSAKLTLVILPEALLTAVGFSAGTILISAWLPAKRAAKITPISAIRKSSDIKINPRISKSSLLIQKLCGLEGSLAYKNIKRNKKRYRITLFSLIISFVLFICSCSFMMYLKNAYLMQASQYNSDVAMMINGKTKNYDQIQAIVSKAKELSEVSSSSSYTKTHFTASVPVTWLDDNTAKLIDDIDSVTQTTTLSITLIGLDTDSFTDFVMANHIPYEDSAKDMLSAIVCNNNTYQDYHSFKDIQTFSLDTEQTINLYRKAPSADSQDVEISESVFTASMKLAAFTNASCPGVDCPVYTANTVYMVIPMDAYEKLLLPALESEKETNTMIEFTTSDHTKLSNSLDCLIQEHEIYDITMYSMDYLSLRESNEKLLIIMNIFIFGFVTLILAISITNIYNTISTSLHLRKQEFAMIRSVGMAPASFHRMLRFESLLYAFQALLIGIPVSIGFCYLIYQTMKDNFDSSFLVPWIPLAAGAIGLTFILYLVMQLSAHRLKKESIVDNLRNVNQ